MWDNTSRSKTLNLLLEANWMENGNRVLTGCKWLKITWLWVESRSPLFACSECSHVCLYLEVYTNGHWSLPVENIFFKCLPLCLQQFCGSADILEWAAVQTSGHSGSQLSKWQSHIYVAVTVTHAAQPELHRCLHAHRWNMRSHSADSLSYPALTWRAHAELLARHLVLRRPLRRLALLKPKPTHGFTHSLYGHTVVCFTTRCFCCFHASANRRFDVWFMLQSEDKELLLMRRPGVLAVTLTSNQSHAGL